MSTRIFRNKRVIYHGDAPRGKDWKATKAVDRYGNSLSGAPIPPDSPQSPFRAGVALWCSRDEVYYRCVDSLNVAEGWGTAAFWTKRWDVDYRAIVSFVAAGLLDAVVEKDSKVRRYRCRDEFALKTTTAWKQARRRRACQKADMRRRHRMKLVERDALKNQ